MTIKNSGKIGIDDVVTEFGLTSTQILNYLFPGATSVNYDVNTSQLRVEYSNPGDFTFTAPQNLVGVTAYLSGAGGGGGGGCGKPDGNSNIQWGYGGGGGGGGEYISFYPSLTIDASYNLTVGLGGSGGAPANNGWAGSGNAGGSTSIFGRTASGGNGGQGGYGYCCGGEVDSGNGGYGPGGNGGKAGRGGTGPSSWASIPAEAGTGLNAGGPGADGNVANKGGGGGGGTNTPGGYGGQGGDAGAGDGRAGYKGGGGGGGGTTQASWYYGGYGGKGGDGSIVIIMTMSTGNKKSYDFTGATLNYDAATKILLVEYKTPGSYSFKLPSNTVSAKAILVGAGAGGAGGGEHGTYTVSNGKESIAGAAGGSGCKINLDTFTLDASLNYNVVVGAGGQGGAPGNGVDWGDGFSGSDGGFSKLSLAGVTLAVANGGTGGKGPQSTNSISGGTGGTGTIYLGTGSAVTGGNGSNGVFGNNQVLSADPPAPAFLLYGGGGKGGNGGSGVKPGGGYGSYGSDGLVRIEIQF